MKRALLLTACCWALMNAAAAAQTDYITVAGLGGEPDYVQRYTADAQALDRIFRQNSPADHVTTLTGAAATREHLLAALAAAAQGAKAGDDFVLVLIGHGTDDGYDYKFNLVGPDVSAAELARACDRIASRRQLIVLTSEASGGAVAALERPGRAVIAATKSGTEKNATVFARYFVAALQDPSADLDKNQAISALEAFEYATRQVGDFYTSQQRLATEHAQFEDTGKGQPVRAPAGEEGRLLASITLTRFGAAQLAYADPAKRKLLQQKEELERKIDALNYQKDALSDADYRTQMTALLLQLAQLQKEIDH